MKRNQNRLWCLFLSAVMLFSLASCGKDGGKSSGDPNLIKLDDYELLYKSACIMENSDGKDALRRHRNPSPAGTASPRNDPLLPWMGDPSELPQSGGSFPFPGTPFHRPGTEPVLSISRSLLPGIPAGRKRDPGCVSCCNRVWKTRIALPLPSCSENPHGNDFRSPRT